MLKQRPVSFRITSAFLTKCQYSYYFVGNNADLLPAFFAHHCDKKVLVDSILVLYIIKKSPKYNTLALTFPPAAFSATTAESTICHTRSCWCHTNVRL